MEEKGVPQNEAEVKRFAVSTITHHNLLAVFVFVLGAVLIWQKPKNLPAVLAAFVFVALAVMLSGLTDALGRARPEYALPVRFLRFMALAGLFLVFSLLPDGRFRWRWQAWLSAAIVLAAGYFSVLKGSTLDMPLQAENTAYAALVAGAALLVMLTLVLRLRGAGTEIARQQLKWILFGSGLAVGWVLFLHLLYFIDPQVMRGLWSQYFRLINMVVIAASMGCVVVAILQFQLFDIDIVINRGLVYGALILFIVATHALVVGGLSMVFNRFVPEGDTIAQVILPLIATSLIVLAFQPLRDRLQRAVNRLMYGQRSEPYEVITRLGQRLESAIDPVAALNMTVEIVAQALKLPYAAILLQPGEFVLPSIAYGTPRTPLARFPLIYAGEPIGEFLAGQRANNEPFSEADLRLLGDLARLAGAAIHAARLNADLQRARERLVIAQEEERRRIRRDLHDGLGASLAAFSLQVGEVQRLMASEPETSTRLLADRRLADLRAGLRAAIGDTRRLVYGLRPPALDELGLLDALRSRIAQYQTEPIQFCFEGPDPLPPLPAAVEVAIYRIVEEGLANIAHHAQAKNGTVTLALAEQGVRVEIHDDGAGMPEVYTPGIGLNSMRERTAELGGNLSIQSAPGQGTRVSAWLPLPRTKGEE
jgi:signal transduction histidine kinase